MGQKTDKDLAHPNKNPIPSGFARHQQAPNDKSITWVGELELWDIDELLIVGFWPLLGGSHNLDNRERRSIRNFLEDNAERVDLPIRNAITHGDRLRLYTAADVFNRVERHLQDHLFDSAYCLERRFPSHIQKIYGAIQMQIRLSEDNGKELPQFDMSEECSRGLIDLIKKVIRDRLYQYIAKTDPSSLHRKMVVGTQDFEVSNDNWTWFLQKQNTHPEFNERNFLETMREAKEIRNISSHPYHSSTSWIRDCAGTAIKILQIFAKLQKQDPSPIEDHLQRLQKALQQEWDVRSNRKKAETYNTLCRLVTELPAEDIADPLSIDNKIREAMKAVICLKIAKERQDYNKKMGVAFLAFGNRIFEGSKEDFHYDSDDNAGQKHIGRPLGGKREKRRAEEVVENGFERNSKRQKYETEALDTVSIKKEQEVIDLTRDDSE